MGIFRELFDKAAARFITALIGEFEKRRYHPHRLLLEQAQQEAADYASRNMANAVILKDQKEVLGFALSRMDDNGSILEFGVASGDSIRLIAGMVNRPVHGFDSFEGLPEDWGGRHEGKGHYSTNGQLPAVPSNVTLHKGWFENTLDSFCQSNDQSASFLHIDCDLYSSTRTVLEHLKTRIRPGTIIVFDEYFNFTSWKNHEFKAFHEFVKMHQVEYDYLCWGYQQVAVMIRRKPTIEAPEG